MRRSKKDKLKEQKEPGTELAQTFVTKEDFEEQIGKILSVVERLASPKPVEEPSKAEKIEEKEQKSSEVDSLPISPKWREAIDEILGKDFGLNVSYPETGGRFIFKLLVPKSKSNASEAHWSFYKSDVRSKAVTYSEGIDGIRQFCEQVRKNLRLDPRNIVK